MINEMTVISGTLLDDSVNLSLYELCRLCGVNAERIMDMIDENLMVRDLARKKAAELIISSAVKKEPEAEAPAEAEPEEETKD